MLLTRPTGLRGRQTAWWATTSGQPLLASQTGADWHIGCCARAQIFGSCQLASPLAFEGELCDPPIFAQP